MPFDAPYSGGFSPGARIYAMDGDFTVASPAGPPEIYNPLPGDSVPSVFPIVLLDRFVVPPAYSVLPLGSGFNVQDFNASQASIILEQEFMVAEAWHVPLPLNTQYDTNWSVGWGNNYADLSSLFLVEEGPLEGVGAGLVRFKRKYANLPPNRNEFESYNATFPALNYGLDESENDIIRFTMSRIVNSRVFYEYFLLDNLNLMPSIPLFPAGHRINTTTLGTDARYLTWEEFKGFKAETDAITRNNVLDPDQPLDDSVNLDAVPPVATTPTASEYQSWIFTNEIVAEASSFNRWLGNIHLRRTRFVLAQ